MNEFFYGVLVIVFFALSGVLLLCLLIQKLQEQDLRSRIDEYKSKIDEYRIDEYKSEMDEYRKKWFESVDDYCNVVETTRADYKKLKDIIDNYKKENDYLKSDNRCLREELEWYRDQETEVNNEEED